MKLSGRICSIILLAGMLLLGQVVSAEGPALRLRNGDVTLDPQVSLAAAPRDALPEAGHYLIQLTGSLSQQQLDTLRAAGVTVLRYLPDDAYIVTLPAGFKTAEALGAMPFVRWVGPFESAWKLDAQIGRRNYTSPERQALSQQGMLRLTVVLFDGEDVAAAVAQIAALPGVGIESIQEHPGANSVIEITLPHVVYQQIADLEAVQWVEEAPEMVLRNDTNKWILQTNVSGSTTVWDKGLTGQGQIAGHIDGGTSSGMNYNHCAFRDPEGDPPGVNHRKVVAYFGGTGVYDHATHTGGTFYGDPVPVGGAATYRGIAYSAKVAFSSYGQVGSLGLYNTFVQDQNAGGRVHSNSWGTDGTTAYTQHCVDVDRFTFNFENNLVLFAVTNAGGVVYTPENAKNCLAVNRGSDTPNQGNACGSISAGPTADGRRKPEIMAPGCSTVSSTGSGTSCTYTGSGWTGTSMACPAVAGAGLLVRQYFTDGFYPTGAAVGGNGFVPSGALIKAMLLNSSVDMTGISGFPSNSEGWGRVLLENALFFAGDARKLIVLDDLRNASGLTQGQNRTYQVNVASGQFLKATLVWAEKEATLNANPAYINNLNLTVAGPGGTFLGNVFSGGQSATGGTADVRNNVEQVLLNAPAAGLYTVTVNAATVNPLYGPQGFALVVTGDVTPFVPIVYGDCDGNGVFQLVPDTDCFVGVLLEQNLDPGSISRSDMNGDTFTNADDVAQFVDCAVNGCP